MGISHKYSTPRGRHGPIDSEAGDDVLLSGLCVRGYRHPLGYVKPRHSSRDPVALAIYPDLTIIINAGLKENTGTLDVHTVHPLRQCDSDTKPTKSESTGPPFLNVIANLPR